MTSKGRFVAPATRGVLVAMLAIGTSAAVSAAEANSPWSIEQPSSRSTHKCFAERDSLQP